MKNISWYDLVALAKTGKFSAEQLIFWANNVLGHRIGAWEVIVGTGKLSIDQMFEAGKNIKEESLWTIIASQIDWVKMTSEEKLTLARRSEAEKTGAWPIGNAVAESIDWEEITLDQKIELVKLFPSSFTGNNINSKFIASFDWPSLSLSEMMDIGNQVENEVVWKKIIETGKLSKEKMIELGKKEKKYSLWVAIRETAKFSTGFTNDEITNVAGPLTPWRVMLSEVKWENLSNDEKIELGKKSLMWDLIVEKLDWASFDIERAIEVGLKIKNPYFWKALAQKADWSKLALTPEKKIETAQKIKNWDIWAAIVHSINWLDYSQEQLINIGKKIDRNLVWIAIIATKKLSVDQMFSIGNDAGDSEVWKAVIDSFQTIQ